MIELLGTDIMLFIIPLVAFILGYCYTGTFKPTKSHSEEEHISQEIEFFSMNKQVIHNLGFFAS